MTPTPSESCELCGKTSEEHGVVLIAMQPGPDGKEWFLCGRDHVEGLKPMKLGNIPAEYKIDIAPPKKRRAS